MFNYFFCNRKLGNESRWKVKKRNKIVSCIPNGGCCPVGHQPRVMSHKFYSCVSLFHLGEWSRCQILPVRRSRCLVCAWQKFLLFGRNERCRGDGQTGQHLLSLLAREGTRDGSPSVSWQTLTLYPNLRLKSRWDADDPCEWTTPHFYIYVLLNILTMKNFDVRSITRKFSSV